MFAKCVSRTFVAIVLAFALAVVPAAGALAAPAVPADAAPSHLWVGIEQWVVDWTQNVLDTLRLRPWSHDELDDPRGIAIPLPDDEGIQRFTADEGSQFDPDG